MREKRTVLVIEDNELNREILVSILEDGYRVLAAENGAVGFEILQNQGSQISLILLDIEMPVMNGHQFLDAVRESGKYTDIPVIVTTASGEVENEIKTLASGASDFVAKPYNPTVIQRRVESLIRLREASAVLHRVERDELTGVYTKEFFYEYVRQALSAGANRDYDMLCCDIEAFNMVNERHGIRNGDEVLRYLAERLLQHRPADAYCGRIGGDIFAVLLPSREMEDYRAAAAELCAEMAEAPVPNLTVKSGVYRKVDPALPISVICDNACMACDSIKNQYGKLLAEYDNSLKEKKRMEQIMMDSAPASLQRHDFRVYFQPKHDLYTGELKGAEALVRWFHPKLGFMNPGIFIQLFEQNGYISELDAYILEEVCRAQQQWLRSGAKTVPVSINVSRADFANPTLVEDYAAIVDRYGVPHELIHFEVTESSVSDDPARIIAAAAQFRQNGFRVELDDFGSGYSSLETLGTLPVDVLKLDMSLARGVTEEKQRCVVECILMLAERLGMNIVAEGVETEEQLESFRQIGAEKALKIAIQGYYFSKPLPAEEYESYAARCAGKA